MTTPNPSNPDLKRPQHPTQSTSESGATTPMPETATGPDSRAMATSTAAAHGLRARLNQDVDHAAGLQGAYLQAAAATADEAADFFAAAMSGELFWSEVSRRTQEKLAAIPKPQPVPDFSQGLKRLPPPSWQRNGETQNRYLPSATGSFGEYENPYANDAA